MDGTTMSAVDVHKAAVLLVSLPAEEAALVMSKLTPRQVEAVSVEIARIEHVSVEEQAAAIGLFAQASPAAVTVEGGGLNRVRDLIQKALGDKASECIDNVRQQIEAVPFGFLSKVDSQNLLTFVIDEHPQTIALILSYLPAAMAAEVIAGLPAERGQNVIRRIATMGRTSPEIIAEVEEGLRNRMKSALSQHFQNAGGVQAVAEILNVTDRATERALMETLNEADPELAEEIRRRMFVFEDLAKLSNKDVQNVLKNVETNQWAMALKGASDELKQVVLGNMSTRAAQLLKEEMEYLGSVRVADVEGVQQQIVDIIRRLEDAGEITVHAEGGGDQMVQ
jgi:flagellar motor switch protein FliG